MPGYRTLAHNHDFTVLWAGETVSALGSALSMFAFPLLAWHLTHSTLQTALVESLFLLGRAGTLLPAGVLADRFDRRRLMRLASGSGVLLYGSLVLAGALGVLTIGQLLVVALLTGVGGGLFAPAESSAVRTVVPTEDLGTALSQNQAREHIASLLGGPLGGVLYAATRWLPFAADAVSFAVSWLALGRLRTDLSPTTKAAPTRARDDLAEGFRFMYQRPFFRVLMVFGACVNLLLNGLFFVVILQLIRAGTAPAQIGLVETVAGLAGIAGAMLAPTVIARMRTGWLTLMAAWTCALAPVPLLFGSGPFVVMICVAALLLPNPAGNAGIGAYRAAATPDRLQGRVSAASQFLSLSTMPLAPVVGGAAYALVGGSATIAGFIAATALVALGVTSCRSVRSVPRPDQWHADAESTAVAENPAVAA